MNLGILRNFVRVVETGSFSAAAREAGVQQSAVSRQIAELERRLGVSLLIRSTRALSVTEAGQSYYVHAKAALSELDAGEASVRDGARSLSGPLTIAASVGFGRAILLPHLAPFLSAHPGVRIDLRLSDQFIDLIEEGIDLAVRIGPLRDSTLTARKLCISRRVLVASKAYLDRRGRPLVPEDLRRHDCLVYTGRDARDAWTLHTQDGEEMVIRVSGPLSTNSSQLIHAGVCDGYGIAYAPEWLFARELASGDVERVLADYPPEPSPIHLLFPAGRRSPARVTAFADHLSTALANI